MKEFGPRGAFPRDGSALMVDMPVASGTHSHEVSWIMRTPKRLRNPVMDFEESRIGTPGSLASMPVALQNFSSYPWRNGRAAALSRLVDDGILLEACHLAGGKGHRAALGRDFRLTTGWALVHVDLDGGV